MAERRAAFYRKWMSIAAEVHEEEKQLKEREIRACEALGASEAGRISKARHMAGRMSFASGQIFGRLSKSCLKAFYSVLERSSTELDPGTVAALSMYVEIAQDASATINFGQRPCVFVYTDASLEPTERGNVAGSPSSQVLKSFPEWDSLHLVAGASCSVALPSNCGNAFKGARRVLLRQRWRKSLSHDRGKLQGGK